MELAGRRSGTRTRARNRIILAFGIVAIMHACGCFRTIKIESGKHPYEYVDLRNVPDVRMRDMVREALEECGMRAVDTTQVQRVDFRLVLMCSVAGAFTSDDLAEETRTSFAEIPGSTYRERTLTKSPRMVKTQIHVTLRNRDERTVYSAGGEFLGDGKKGAVLSALTDALTKLTADCRPPTQRASTRTEARE